MVAAWVGRELPDPRRLTSREVAQSTKIFDRTGKQLLYEVYQDAKRTIVPLSDISPWAVKATIAVEDKHFYEHRGIRPLSIARAAFNNLIGRRTGAGGASTLTQQLIKNALVGSERSYWRKVKEAILALRLERKYTKDEILAFYLNEVSYGSTNYGVESAARSYFHKPAKELTLAEGAALAALTKAPSRFLNNLNALRDRRDLVLRLMAEQRYITAAQKEEAQQSALRLYRRQASFPAPHFVTYVESLLADRFGERLVATGGLTVITTLDFARQQLAENIITEIGNKFAKEEDANNAALVAIDPKTAQIVALVGSRDFNDETIGGQFNVVVDGRLQPGSSFKPFVYTAAWERGFTPATTLYDVSTDFDLRDGARYQPRNFDNKERGFLTMRTALQGSLNIPAVKTMYLVGGRQTVEFARRFGYSTFPAEPDLTLVLGGYEVSMLEHTNGYATLANGGHYRPPAAILKVTDPSGAILYEGKETPGEEAVKPELAALTTSVLSDNAARAFVFGTRNNLILPDRPVAAKTGTTQNRKDAWTLGYVPQLAAGVWVGNGPVPKSMKSGGIKLAGIIWNRFMKAALASTTPEQFPAPPEDPVEKPVLRGRDGGIVLPINTISGKIATSSTPESLIEYRTYLPPHDILHYVRRDDPRGALPDNPADDPQYENWERAVQEWVERERAAGRAVELSDPPTEYDTSSPELTPTVEIITPAAGSRLASRQLTIVVKAAAPRGVFQVSYELDNVPIGVSRSFPFSLTYYLRTHALGSHRLKAIASDDQGNSAVAETEFELSAPFDPPTVEWLDRSPLTLRADDFPRAMYLTPFRWEDAKEIKIYLQGSDGSERLIYTFNHAEDKLFNRQLTFTWRRHPGPGDYTLRALLTSNDGRTDTKNLEVVVKE